ncbi:serine/threonine-protein kinase MRCK alpha-like isoform X2 [Penaeus japonicus]|uniref:serine/threonine-protein kinase MRCK alpha-like isoform X2 n=1 Tax=Penaeus japonicus TaxID=27405 RepID=UPI001C7147EE|nr:serine/threonine-protein kinase MRCK alpha-like isoform X2 [Penaeus japonicus]
MMGDGQEDAGGGGGSVVAVGGGGVGGVGDGSIVEMDVSHSERRLRELEHLFLSGPVLSDGQSYSMETLLDVLLVLFDECTNSSLRREKTVSDFIEYGKREFPFPWLCMYLRARDT